MKDKVKRRRILNQRKTKNLLNKYDFDVNNIAFEKQKQKLDEQQNNYDQILIEKLKLKAIKEKVYQLNQDFYREKIKEYKSILEFLSVYRNVKKKRQQIVNEQKHKIKKMKHAYQEKYETVSFKCKRWFFGMGKEFNRIRWANKKMIFVNLLIVLGITIFLAVIFLLIDVVFNVI